MAGRRRVSRSHLGGGGREGGREGKGARVQEGKSSRRCHEEGSGELCVTGT